MNDNKYGYVVITVGFDPYCGPDVEEFDNERDLISYLRSDKVYLRKHLVSILEISKDVTKDFTIYLT